MREREPEGLSLVCHIAHRLVARLPPSVEFEDLVQEGYVGWLEAQRRYRGPDEYDRRRTWAWRRVRGAMLDYLRSLDMQPRFRSRTEPLTRLGLDDVPEVADEARAEDGVLVLELMRRVDRLPPVQRDALRAIYVDGLSLAEHAAARGISQSSCCQTHRRGVEAVRRAVHAHQ